MIHKNCGNLSCSVLPYRFLRWYTGVSPSVNLQYKTFLLITEQSNWLKTYVRKLKRSDIWLLWSWRLLVDGELSLTQNSMNFWMKNILRYKVTGFRLTQHRAVRRLRLVQFFLHKLKLSYLHKRFQWLSWLNMVLHRCFVACNLHTF